MMAPNRRNLTASVVTDLQPDPAKMWDAKVLSLCVTVQPSGAKAFYDVYSIRGRPKFYWLGPGSLNINEVRRRAKLLIARVAGGHDPQAELS